jgi:hypothetical protein
MSDTEEVVISRSAPRVPDSAVSKRNTKTEIAREKLKEKRERLKKEKENLLIEEAKKRLAEDSKKAEQEALLSKQKEEEQKLKDPSYAMLKRMEEMMAMFQSKVADSKGNSVELPSKEEPVKKKRAPRKKVEIVEPEPEPEPEPEKPKRKQKQIVDKPNKAPGLPKPRKKVVYLQQDPVPEESTQFVGYDIAPPAEPVQYQPSNGLLSALMGRRNMNTAYL